MHAWCAGGKDPKALESLVSAMSVSGESVNRDLMTYKVSCHPSVINSRTEVVVACSARLHPCSRSHLTLTYKGMGLHMPSYPDTCCPSSGRNMLPLLQ